MNNLQKAAQKRVADPVWRSNQAEAALKRARPVLCVTTGTVYQSKGQAAVALGLNVNRIYDCLTGKQCSTGGYEFTFLDS